MGYNFAFRSKTQISSEMAQIGVPTDPLRRLPRARRNASMGAARPDVALMPGFLPARAPAAPGPAATSTLLSASSTPSRSWETALPFSHASLPLLPSPSVRHGRAGTAPVAPWPATAELHRHPAASCTSSLTCLSFPRLSSPSRCAAARGHEWSCHHGLPLPSRAKLRGQPPPSLLLPN
jgi:hypothetical protein